MASVYGFGNTNEDPRSGGKIVTKRHTRLNPTPYDRPSSSLQLPPKNRSWISDVIFPATRAIASGAAKLWSSVFDDSDDDSSLSSSDSIADSENDIEDDNNYYDTSDDINCSVEDHGATSEAMPQPSPQTNDANHVEQLLLKGEFSRQDCQRFMKLIESRVSGSNFQGGEGSTSTETLGGNLGSYMDDVCSKAVLEARKWLEEKKVGYSPLSHRADASDRLNSFSLKHLKNDVVTPADLAKVYMKYRPPWASLSGEHSEERSPLTLTSPILRGELFSSGEGSLSSVKKRSSLASGSWNIHEEIRKVRSKATEDLLRSSSCAKNDMSSIALSGEHGQGSSVTKLSIPVRENEGTMLNSSENIEQLDLLSKIATTGGNYEISDSEVIERMAENKALEKEAIPATTTSVSRKYSGLQSIKIAGESTTSMSDPASKVPNNEHVEDSSRIHLKGSLVDKISKCDPPHNGNNLSTSVTTLSTEVGIEENKSKLIEKNINDEKAADFIHKHGFLTEASVVAPVVGEITSSDNRLHPHSGMGDEELLGELSRPYADKVVKETEGVAVKPEGKKIGKYSRRNKVRGK